MSMYKSKTYEELYPDCSPEMIDYFLAKNLAGMKDKVTGEQFMNWAKLGVVPSEEDRWTIREALDLLQADEIMLVIYDGRATPEQIARFAVICELDRDGQAWNNYLQAFHPELPVHPYKEQWHLNDKAILWNVNLMARGT